MLKAVAAAALCQTTLDVCTVFQFLLPCVELYVVLCTSHTCNAELCCIVPQSTRRKKQLIQSVCVGALCGVVQSNPLRLTTPSVFWLVLLLFLIGKNGGYATCIE